METDDMGLLRQYAQNNSEQAFATLVSRHVNLVYSVALRQVRNPHTAEEISQAVFILLAQKAKSLDPKTILPGWLCRAARYVSANTLKTQRRRQIREQELQMQSSFQQPDGGAWNQIAPLLDEALNCLGEKEHDALVLRFINGLELKEVGAMLGTSEDAARMQVNRAIEKLRKYFSKKGATLSAAAIAGAIASHSVQSAPAGLAAAVTAATLSGSSVASVSLLEVSRTIAMTTLQKAIVTITVGVLAGAIVYQTRQAANARAATEAVQQQQKPLTARMEQLERERHEATVQLAALRQDNERLNRNTAELLRLRGEVGVLRQQSKEAQRIGAENGQLRRLLTTSATELAAFKQQEENVFNDMKQLVEGIKAYARNHDGVMATNFNELVPVLSVRTNENGSGVSLLSGTGLGNFEFMNVGAVSETTPHMATFREKNSRLAPDGRWARIYGFADGTAVKRYSTNASFELYERALVLQGSLIEKGDHRDYPNEDIDEGH